MAPRTGRRMRLAGDLGQLTWCMNIHPTETWAECRAALTGPVAEVKRAMEGRFPAVEGFAVGLRFSVNALEELADAEARAELAAIIADHDYRPITVNGFPYGAFRGVAVKEEVYQPDWTRPERLAYTNALADLMAELKIGRASCRERVLIPVFALSLKGQVHREKWIDTD